MKRFVLLGVAVVLLGGGCISSGTVPTLGEQAVERDVVLPFDEQGATYYAPRSRRFGEFFNDGRFYGYHTGEDAEAPPEEVAPGRMLEYPVRAVADGKVAYLASVSGYGGVIVLQHALHSEKIQTLYGHLDIGSSLLKVGDQVHKGQYLANLGADHSAETDDNRQHLHFAVYPGTEVKLAGYVSTPDGLQGWINPQDFFAENGVTSLWLEGQETISSDELWYPLEPRTDIPQYRTEFGDLSFQLPNGWDVEALPASDTLHLFVVTGTGSAAERTKITITKVNGTYQYQKTDPDLDQAVYDRFLASVQVLP